MRRSVPPHKTLLARLLALSVTVAVCSIAATAWLAAQTTSGAFRQEQGRALAEDARIHNSLLAVAAREPGWKGVDSVIAGLARDTDRRITLTTLDGHVIADSGSGTLPPRAKAAGVVDPLNVDSALRSGTAGERIDPRAVGPYSLPDAERTALRALAGRGVDCLRRNAVAAEINTTFSGRAYVAVANDPQNLRSTECAVPELDKPTATESAALDKLDPIVNDCLKRHGVGRVRLHRDYSWDMIAPHTSDADAIVGPCVDSGRREQLAAYVSAPALLYIGGAEGTPATGLSLSSGGTGRIAGAAALVLVVTLAVTAFVAIRLVRPLRALSAAAGRMKEGDLTARVDTGAGGEIGALAATFNGMSEARARLEGQRKAMVSDIAHELRTPLSTMRNQLEAAQDQVIPTDPELVSSLLEETVQLQHIIDDLRDLAAADAGTLRLHPEPVPVLPLLRHVASAHGTAAQGAGVVLTAVGDEDLRPSADPVRLRQIVDNLVSNAVRHTPPGGTVTLRASTEGDTALIEVADTGTGIAADELPHVFDRFWRAEKSRSRATGGSGLGLAIVRRLAEAHGGGVTVSSTYGQGTAFRVCLPLAGPAGTGTDST
ncbi:sensor histidine kinase [Streptomyces gamaensis]|uniref:histidine kinase n=1 Tax=Streptomyces gamaensis TaxID=1763542 RepID=A0ABW0Z8S7_9ACTN